MVCELELKYGTNYTKVFAFKQLDYYVQYEALDVTTLTLGLRPRQRLARVRAKKEAQESYLMLSGVQKSVREWTLTLPNELPF